MCWASEQEGHETVRQGVALKTHSLFLSDLLETIIAPAEIPPHVSAAYPALTQQEYDHATECIWLMISSLQWFQELSAVETGDPAERDRMINGLRSMLLAYREDPKGFSRRNGA
jgi:hypothetical protein